MASTSTEGAFTEEERAAMKEHAAEVKASRKRGGTKAEKAAADAQATVEKIAQMPEPDRGLAERVHRIALEVENIFGTPIAKTPAMIAMTIMISTSVKPSWLW